MSEDSDEESLVVLFGDEDGSIVGSAGDCEFDNNNQNYVSEDNDE